MVRIFLSGVFFFIIVCGGEQKGSSPPEIEFAFIEPGSVTVTDQVNVVYKLKKNKNIDVKIEWFVNDQKVKEGPYLDLQKFSKGDEIYAVITPFKGNIKGKSFRTKSIVIKNSRPKITDLSVTPEVVRLNTPKIELLPVGEDKDGDPVEFLYEWFINGEKIENDKNYLQLNNLNIKGGDEIKVVVYAFDGEEKSLKSKELIIVIENAPPQISNNPYIIKKENQVIVKFNVKEPENEKVIMELIDSDITPSKVNPDSFLLVFDKEKIFEKKEINLTLSFQDKTGNRVEKKFTLTIK